MAARAGLLALTAAAALAQAPWPQAGGDADNTRRAGAAWPRGSGGGAPPTLALVAGFPLCSPLLIGARGTMFGQGCDGLLYAVQPSGAVLWTYATQWLSVVLFSECCGNTAFHILAGHGRLNLTSLKAPPSFQGT